MKKYSFLLLTLLACAWCAGLADAAIRPQTAQPGSVPGGINYQGQLQENGIPVTSQSPWGFVFSVWNSQLGGQQIGPSMTTSANIITGLFSVNVPVTTSTLVSGGQLWLQVEVDQPGTLPGSGQTMTPREQLFSVPYALVAQTVEGTIDISTGGFTVTTPASSNALYISSATGRIGIGTSAPSYLLDVQGGDINASGNLREAGTTMDTKYALVGGGNATGGSTWGINITGNAGTVSNGAYFNSANNFTQSNTFSAAGNGTWSIQTSSGILVANGMISAPYLAGTLIGNVSGTVSGNINANQVAAGTFNSGTYIFPGSIGSPTLTGPSAGAFAIDAGAAIPFDIGGVNATTLNLGRSGQAQALLGNGTVAGTLGVTGLATLGNATVGGTLTGPTAATFTIDSGGANTIAIGGTNATTLNLGRSGQTQALLGNGTVAGTLGVTGLATLGNATVGGALTGPTAANFTIDSGGANTIAIGGTNATTLNLGRSGQTQALLGNGTVAGTFGVTGNTTLSGALTGPTAANFTIDSGGANAITIGGTNATTLNLGRSAGTVTLPGATAAQGQILCLTTANAIGHCTAGASCSGTTCTCTCTAN
jgi:hypothetical protein